MLPMDEYAQKVQLEEIRHLHDQLAIAEAASLAREQQLNRINIWLAAHGSVGSDEQIADHTIIALNSLTRDNKHEELGLLRVIVDQLAPVVERKFEAGVCMHDILTYTQFKAIRSMIATLRGIQALKYITPIME